MSQAASAASLPRAGAGTSTTGASEPGQRCTIRCWCPELCIPGDPHIAQGDGEISGTAIEASLNVTLQFVLHKDFHLRTQLLVTPTHWMVHAYHEDLNKGMYQAALEMLDFLTTHKGLSAEDAYD